MSSTERHIRGALIEEKARVMLIDYSQNAFPQSNNEERAWDRSPELYMEHLNSSAPTDLPAWGVDLKQLCKAEKTNIPFHSAPL